jgi:hypothetical protein
LIGEVDQNPLVEAPPSMRTKVTLVLLFLNVALFFFIFKFERSWRTEAASLEARRRVLGGEAADIRSLEVTGPAGPVFSLVRQRDTWMLAKPLEWPANPHAVSSILQELLLLENETSFSTKDLAKNGQSLADYGLDKPKLIVAFRSGEGAAPDAGSSAAMPTTLLRIGDATKVGHRLYILSPDGTRIHVVKRSLADVLSLPLEQLRADTLFTIPVFETRALRVQTTGVRVQIRHDGPRWLFDTIINARASKTAMELAINGLNGLHVKTFVPPPPSLPSAAPSLRVTLDDNHNRSETLLLGEPVTAPKPATPNAEPSGASTEYYAQLMNGNIVRTPVFTVAVPADLLETLRKAPDLLREKRVLDFEPASVTAITIEAPGQAPVTLQRLDPTGTRPDGTGWQLVQRGDGASGPHTRPADTEAVQALLNRLTLLAAKSFESDAPSNAQLESWGFNRPEREITLTSVAAAGGTATPSMLRLGTDNRGGVFARVGTAADPGSSIYRVEVDLPRDFPVDAIAWRQRDLRELPASARIIAVKLTDLSTHETVFDTTGGSDKPAIAARDAEAAQVVTAALRKLHAKRFVRDDFEEKLILGGEERPWRFQLEAVVSLPGGTGGEQTSTTALFLTERVGGGQQLAGSKEFEAVFEIDQPLLDALWRLTYGPRDPGPQPEKK